MTKSKSRIIIGYYTVDCTIPNYIWTSAQMTTIWDEPISDSNMVKTAGHEILRRWLYMGGQLHSTVQ